MSGLDAAAIARALDPRARRGAGSEWAARCPCHDDKEASFSIRDGDNDRVLFKCFAGCDQRALAAELLKRGLLGGNGDRDYTPPPRHADYSNLLWQPIMPVPPDAPAPPASHPARGKPSRIWTYLSEDGEVLFYVLRFDKPDGGKDIIPLTYGTLNGKLGWQWKALKDQRPLFNLDQLAARPDAPVIVTEGEKAADAAAKLFPNHVATTWPSGAEAVARAYWPSLEGRKVTIWPDADAAGAKAAKAVAEMLRGIAASVRLVELPEGLPDKWDLADPIPEGVDIHALLRGAPEPEPEWKSALNIIRPTEWQGKPIPERRWLVRDWVPEGHVTALYGNGGTGKSLLAQQLLTACAIGAPWLGLETKPCRVIGFFCEDTDEELHRRQDDINLLYGCQYKDLGNMEMVSRVHLENILMDFGKDGTGSATKLLEHLIRWAQDFGAEGAVIDTAADTFGGNENVRKEVRLFIQKCLGSLVRAINGSVFLCAHPSVAGMSTGTGGSTGWSNSVRSRLHLHVPDPKDKDAEIDPDARVLGMPKANYARTGSLMQLRWQNGVLVPEARAAGSAADRKMEREHCKDVFLRLLAEFAEVGKYVNDSPQGKYAPREMALSPNSGGYSKAEFAQAMRALVADKRIRLETVRRQRAFVICPPRTAGNVFPFTAYGAP